MDGEDCNIPFAFFKKKRGDNEEGAFVEAECSEQATRLVILKIEEKELQK